MQEIYHELPIILTIFDFFKSMKRREKESMKAPSLIDQRIANNALATRESQLEFEETKLNRFSEDPTRLSKRKMTFRQPGKVIPE